MTTVAAPQWRREPAAGLPPAVEQLLRDLVADGFVVYCCGDRTAPTALVASYEWPHCYPAPLSLRVPRHEQHPTTIRLPSAGRAGVRAARLTSLWRPGAADARARATDQQRGQVMLG